MPNNKLVNINDNSEMIRILEWSSPDEDWVRLIGENGHVFRFNLLNPEDNAHLKSVLQAAGCRLSDHDPIYIMLNRIVGKEVNVRFLRHW